MEFLARHLLLRASCVLSVGDDGVLPPWVQVTPRGFVTAADGRQFDFADLPAIVAASKLPLLLDVDHASETGGSSAAAGWVQELAISEGMERSAGLWARVEWTPMGVELVTTKTYRFLSPTFYLDQKSKRVTQLLSVALTNTPALSMTALDYARAAARFSLPEETMPTPNDSEHIVALCAALELEASAEADTIATAAQSATLLREQCTQLAAQVAFLRTDAAGAQERASAAEQRASAAEARVLELQAASFTVEVDACLADAQREGKVTPAQAGKFREFCRSHESFELFKATILPTLPVLASRAPTAPDVTVADPEIQRLTGLTPEQIRNAQQYNAARRGTTEN